MRKDSSTARTLYTSTSPPFPLCFFFLQYNRRQRRERLRGDELPDG